MRVVGYCRVSTEEQAREGVSLDAQEQKLRMYAELYGLELVAVIRDSGVSAKSLDRPGLGEALAALDTGAAEGLLVAKLDRLTRSVRDLGTLLDGYFAARFSLLSVADQIDTRTAGGRLVLNILASVSQWEREAIGERTKAALAYKKSQGAHVGAPRLGARVEGGALVADASEAATVARIQELAAEGCSLRAIAATLAAEGCRTKRGGKWAPETIRKVLARVAA